MARVGPITIGTLNVTGIANLRQIIGDINQSIHRLQDAGGEKIAEILKDIGQAAVADPRLEKRERQATILMLRTLAHEAGVPTEERQPELVKAAIANIPSCLIGSLEILNYFLAHLEDLRKFFDILG
jgi:hypothetical protein